MKKYLFVFVFFACALLVALFFLARTPETANDSTSATVPLNAELPESQKERVRDMVARMSLAEKIGQLFMVSFSGTALHDDEAAWLAEHNIGGVILLGKNVTAREQSHALITDLHGRASATLPAPLLVATDQEGGMVSRFTFFESHERLAQSEIATPAAARTLGTVRGSFLRELGIDINFSPVVDMVRSPDDFMATRAFNGNAETVGILGAELIRGYTDAGILPTAKHFPGHGGTLVDSHRTLPTMRRDLQSQEEHLAPFIAAIAAGVPLVMTAHVLIPEMDAVYPASISSIITTGILRNRLGFTGVVITDDLAMGAITDTYTLPDGAVLALSAGADILLIVSNHDNVAQAIVGVTEAVNDGRISPERIDESVERILLLKDAAHR